jgi:predicted DNA-binding transcriptional regulator YafY
MGRGMSKAERLAEMEWLYAQRAYSDMEMAAMLGVGRTTIFRDRRDLEAKIPFVEDEPGQYRIERRHYVSNVRLNMTEALILYLATRRAALQAHIAQGQMATALEKLAVALRQPLAQRLGAVAERIMARKQEDPGWAALFATVAQGWIEGRQLRLKYQSIASKRTRTHRFSPYLLEPAPWGDGIYLIGASDLSDHLLTLKLDRIVEAEVLGTFTLPADFDEEALLRHAWGIWGGTQPPQQVKLRFLPGPAVRRLQESRWHPQQAISPLPDGGCMWEAPIAEWREMLPWIRSWGAAVEVLAPPDLRTAVMADVRAAAELYGWTLEASYREPELEVDFMGE